MRSTAKPQPDGFQTPKRGLMTPYIGGTQLYALVHMYHLIVVFLCRIGISLRLSRGGHSGHIEGGYALGQKLVYVRTKVLRLSIMPDANEVST